MDPLERKTSHCWVTRSPMMLDEARMDHICPGSRSRGCVWRSDNALIRRMDNSYRSWAARWRVSLGFVLGMACLIFAQPSRWVLLSGGTIALVGVGVRALAAGHLKKSISLATTGPYGYTRNPLYFGSFLMGLGFAIAGNSLALGLAFLGLFLLVYWPVMRREADSLRNQFGGAYNEYAGQVPLFFPLGRMGRPGQSALEASIEGSGFRWEHYRRNREYRAALGYVAGMSFLALKMALR